MAGEATVEPDKTLFPLALPVASGSSRAVEDATRAFNAYCQEVSLSAQPVSMAMAETVRKSTEQTLQFFQDLAGAKDVAGALGLQLAFAASQMQLFMEQSRVLQGQLTRLFLPVLPDTAASNG